MKMSVTILAIGDEVINVEMSRPPGDVAAILPR